MNGQDFTFNVSVDPDARAGSFDVVVLRSHRDEFDQPPPGQIASGGGFNDDLVGFYVP